jgi:hypothetical protein
MDSGMTTTRTTGATKTYVRDRIAHSQRLARASSCPKCRAATLTGPDHDRVAHLATVNAEPIAPHWESRAHAAGLSTYDLDGGKLCYREPWHYATAPFPIHVWHVCR